MESSKRGVNKMDRREMNRNIFKDTERMCKTDAELSDATKVSVANQRFIAEAEDIPTPELNIYKKANVVVSKKRTYEAAKAYKGNHVAVHNFASATNPGGGVVNGAGAQEECLCRCSNLYFCLNTPDMWGMFYTPHRAAHDPIHNDDIIYTPDIVVFKTDTDSPELMEREDWYKVDVITCAAPNLRETPSNKYNSGDGTCAVTLSSKELQALHEKRLRRILDSAVMNHADTVILGAFGCGAFRNEPQVVATAAANVVRDYMYAFKNIEFAVYCRPSDDSNYRVFNSVLSSL